MIAVTLLGTGSPMPDPNRAGPATLISVGDDHYLVDAGRGVLMRLAAAGLGAPNLSAVLITHLHSDHITDLNDVITTRWVMTFEPTPLTIDVQSMHDADREELQDRLEQLAQTPFELSSRSLIRVHLLEAAPEQHILLLVMHHIVSDGWSLGVLMHELTLLYSARDTEHNQAVVLAELISEHLVE